MAAFQITIHLNSEVSADESVDAENASPAIDVTPEQPPPDRKAAVVTANTPTTTAPRHREVFRGEPDRDPLREPPGYFRPGKRRDPDPSLN